MTIRGMSFEDDLLYDSMRPLDPVPTRPSRERTLMDVAHVLAKRGTCSRAHVGAVLAKDGRIIATGYNGAPSGMDHCNHQAPSPVAKNDGRTPVVGCTTAEHAERNAIAYAARYGLSTNYSDLYCTHAPCLECSRTIINAGVSRVFYEIPYRKVQGLELLAQAGVEVTRLYV